MPKVNICPKCGCLEGEENNPTHCLECYTKMVETDLNYDDFFTLYSETKDTELKNTLNKLYEKYVFDSPEYDEILFNKRQMKDNIENVEFEQQSKEMKYTISSNIEQNSADEANTSIPTQSNIISQLLRVSAWIMFIIGFILGIVLAANTVKFNLSILLICWLTSFIAGMVLLGFAEIISLLQKLVNNKK